MYIVINGGGKVGSYLVNKLSRAGHDVALIEKREEVLRKLEDELPGSVLLVKGDGCDVKYQTDAGVGHADVFASVTGQDDDNLVACQLARITFHVKRSIARVNSPKNERIFNALGIEAISSTTVIARLIEEKASVSDIIRLFTLGKGNLALVEIDLPAEGPCPSCGKTLAQLTLPKESVLVTVMRGGEAILPKGETVLASGDQILALTAVGHEEVLRKALLGH